MFNKSMPNSYSRRSRSPFVLQAPKKPDRKPRPSGLPFRATPGTVRQLQDILHRRLHEHELNRCDRLASTFLQAGIRPPKCILSATGPTQLTSSVDSELCSALSTLVEKTSLSLAATIALWRNETTVDPRPNKALDPVWLDILLHGYRLQDLVVAVATRGVAHKLNSPRPPDRNHVRNHTSARKFTQALIRSLSDGQASGTYLVLELPTALRWSELRFSPFGCVPKKDVDPLIEARLIHDLSYPCETSTNAKSVPADLPALEYESVRRLAERIEVLARQYPHLQVKILKGDVKSAFRLIPVDAKLAAHFAGSCGGLAIVDMALPFGWTGSPAHYGAFGGAISFLVARESPKSLNPTEQDDESFFSFVWVDDHILLEVDRENRLALAETALRLSMIATLGPKSINEKKFSSWSTRLVALGLAWDTQRRTVSIPADKVHKALNRITDALSRPTVSRHQVEKLLGSLRYLAICCRSTRAFLQRLHQLWRCSSRFQSIRLPQDARHDLHWVASLLQNGAANRVPTSIMAEMLEPAVHLFMDASNEGLAVLYPAAREYIRLQFDEEERLAMKLSTSGSTSWFSINVREALSAVLAVLVWGPQWQATCRPKDRPLHVRCWIDNASAVAWLGDHNTKNLAGQELTRVLSCAELSFNLHVSTKHLDGSSNYLADLGSRAWTGPTLQKWTNHMRLWCQQDIPTEFSKIYKQKLPSCNGSRSPTRHAKGISTHGDNGVGSAVVMASTSGYHLLTQKSNPYNSLCLQLSAGKAVTRTRIIELTPYGLNSAMSDGVISFVPDSDRHYNHNTSWSSMACNGSVPLDGNVQQSPSACFARSPQQPTCPSPSTASFVGLRSWASSFV